MANCCLGMSTSVISHPRDPVVARLLRTTRPLVLSCVETQHHPAVAPLVKQDQVLKG